MFLVSAVTFCVLDPLGKKDCIGWHALKRKAVLTKKILIKRCME